MSRTKRAPAHDDRPGPRLGGLPPSLFLMRMATDAYIHWRSGHPAEPLRRTPEFPENLLTKRLYRELWIRLDDWSERAFPEAVRAQGGDVELPGRTHE